MSPRELLTGSFHAAVDAARADAVLPTFLADLPEPTGGRLIVIGAGKAAAAMAACVEARLPAARVERLSGLVITRHGHGLPTRRVEVVEAGHPLPDAAGLAAARRLVELVAGADPGDHLLALLSGGGSSLLGLPAPGLELADLRATTAALLASGAPIAEINGVRKHLSANLGGRLAALCRAPVTVLAISDVVGDDPATLASGPFAPDPGSYADALAVLARWRVTVPRAAREHLARGAAGTLPETPKPGADCFRRIDTHIVANARTALLGAADWWRRHGVQPILLGDSVTGEAREVAQAHAALAREARCHGGLGRPPLVLLSGGETSVRVRGAGRGGRDSEYLLGLALALDGLDDVHALAADTDGIDGSEDNAGALLAPDSLARARAAGRDARADLDANDAHGFFAALGDLLVTGPTRTNVNDYRAILVA